MVLRKTLVMRFCENHSVLKKVTAIGAPGASKRNLKGLGAGTVIMKNTGTRVLGSRKHTYLAEGEMLGNPMILKCRDYSSFL